MRTLNSKQGISRLKDAWFLSFAGQTRLFKDDKHNGDRNRSLAAAIVERFKLELVERSEEFTLHVGKQGFISRNNKENVVITGVWEDREGYRVSLTKYAPDKSGKTIQFGVDTYGKQNARWLAIYTRHVYNHFFYGELYHENRGDEELNLPKDELLDELGIPHVPDLPTLEELHPEKYPEHKQAKSIDETDSSEDKEPKKREFVLMTSTNPNKTYDQLDFKRIQGVCYSPAVGYFYAIFPGGNKKAFNSKPDPKRAYRDAVKVRHYSMLETHGENYDQIRNDPDNAHPSDKLLEELEIPPEPPEQDEEEEATLFTHAD